MIASPTFERIVTGTLVACALFITGAVAHVVLGGGRRAPSPMPPIALSADLWNEVSREGDLLFEGPGPDHLVVFSDFECPYCRQWAREVLPQFHDSDSGHAKVTFRHWPLPQHRFAKLAAQASLCAGAQGKFKALHDALFEQQDSIGLISFSEFGRRIGISDPGRFEECVSESRAIARLEADTMLVAKLSGRGTPIIILNGVYFPQPPSLAQLDSVLRATRVRRG